MFSPNDCFTKTPTLRIRPVPELGRCMVFTPEHPRLYTLNAAAWLVLELCDGRDLRSLEGAYRAALEADAADPALAAELQATLADFERNGIVGRVTA